MIKGDRPDPWPLGENGKETWRSRGRGRRRGIGRSQGRGQERGWERGHGEDGGGDRRGDRRRAGERQTWAQLAARNVQKCENRPEKDLCRTLAHNGCHVPHACG